MNNLLNCKKVLMTFIKNEIVKSIKYQVLWNHFDWSSFTKPHLTAIRIHVYNRLYWFCCRYCFPFIYWDIPRLDMKVGKMYASITNHTISQTGIPAINLHHGSACFWLMVVIKYSHASLVCIVKSQLSLSLRPWVIIYRTTIIQ